MEGILRIVPDYDYDDNDPSALNIGDDEDYDYGEEEVTVYIPPTTFTNRY